jgi:hypothetical protein
LRDDVTALAQLIQALGVAAAACESAAVYDLLTANPIMPHGQPLFSAAHGNLMAAAALTADSPRHGVRGADGLVATPPRPRPG